MHKQLVAAGIDATLILDSSVGYIMEQVDLVMIGAEGVTESGGIINKVRFCIISINTSTHRHKISSIDSHLTVKHIRLNVDGKNFTGCVVPM